MAKKKKPHHHGDLREALVTAGIELLEQEGFNALTLRKCAARAGVSHAAPAHHFKGLVSLKMAIIARGHSFFAAAMAKEMGEAAPNPMAQLLAVCQGYLIFANHHNALFQLMFNSANTDLSTITPAVQEEFVRNAHKSYGLLSQACEPFENAPGVGNSTEITVWSLVHGFAMLFDKGREKKSDRNAPTDEIPDFSVILTNLGLRLKRDE